MHVFVDFTFAFDLLRNDKVVRAIPEVRSDLFKEYDEFGFKNYFNPKFISATSAPTDGLKEMMGLDLISLDES